jgi:hypothetical protein
MFGCGWCPVPFVLCVLPVVAQKSPLVHDVQGEKLEAAALIEPRADAVIEPETGAPRERQGIDHELGDRLVSDGIRLVDEDMDPAVPDLHEIDVA